MKQEETILKLLTEGGGIELFRSGDTFYYTTNETALLDLLAEDDIDESMLQPQVHEFDSFDAAFKSLMNRYSVFRFSLWHVHPDFKARIRAIYLSNKNDPNETGSGWDRLD